MRDLLEEHLPRVYYFALRLTGDPHMAEDLTQETLLRAWRQRANLREPSAARVWLFRITANLWRDAVRRNNARVARAEPLPDDVRESIHRTDHAAADQDDVQRALLALDTLPDRQREVLHLHACEELSIAEIAAVLETSAGAVKSNLSLARKRMRELLPEMFHDLFPAG